MAKFGLIVTLHAKPGKEKEAEEFLKASLRIVEAEPSTISWYALKFDESRFGIFDTFNDQGGRQEHLQGQVARDLMQKAPDLFIKTPSIAEVEILAEKHELING